MADEISEVKRVSQLSIRKVKLDEKIDKIREQMMEALYKEYMDESSILLAQVFEDEEKITKKKADKKRHRENVLFIQKILSDKVAEVIQVEQEIYKYFDKWINNNSKKEVDKKLAKVNSLVADKTNYEMRYEIQDQQ